MTQPNQPASRSLKVPVELLEEIYQVCQLYRVLRDRRLALQKLTQMKQHLLDLDIQIEQNLLGMDSSATVIELYPSKLVAQHQ